MKEARTAIWEALRGIVSRHRAHGTAKWAMPEEYVARLEGILKRFSPDDPVALYGWLFTLRPPDVGTGDRGKTPWEVRRQRVSDERAKAVVAILEPEGLRGLAEFARAVEYPSALGVRGGECTDGVAAPRRYTAASPCRSTPSALPDGSRVCERVVPILTATLGWFGNLSEMTSRLTADQRVELLLVLPDLREHLAIGHHLWRGHRR